MAQYQKLLFHQKILNHKISYKIIGFVINLIICIKILIDTHIKIYMNNVNN
jgi:hypothetical protein